MFGFRNLVNCLRSLDHSLQKRLEGIEKKMVTRDDFDGAVNVLKQAVVDAANRVATDIQALRDQLASGVPITDADLAAIQGLTVEVGNIDPPVVAPV